MKSNNSQPDSSRQSPWRSLEQLAETWGLSRTRTSLVVKALLRSGRLEQRPSRERRSAGGEYRIVCR